MIVIKSSELARKTAHILDLVEKGEQIIIHRKGIEFAIILYESERETLEEALNRRGKSNAQK